MEENKIIQSRDSEYPKVIYYQKGKLKFKVTYNNKPSEEAIQNFNKFYNQHWNLYNK